ncbi:hypothetical protein V6N13_068503 [Hibiscus sabdariffa]
MHSNRDAKLGTGAFSLGQKSILCRPTKFNIELSCCQSGKGKNQKEDGMILFSVPEPSMSRKTSKRVSFSPDVGERPTMFLKQGGSGVKHVVDLCAAQVAGVRDGELPLIVAIDLQ